MCNIFNFQMVVLILLESTLSRNVKNVLPKQNLLKFDI